VKDKLEMIAQVRRLE